MRKETKARRGDIEGEREREKNENIQKQITETQEKKNYERER